jgi:hypothetical protein
MRMTLALLIVAGSAAIAFAEEPATTDAATTDAAATGATETGATAAPGDVPPATDGELRPADKGTLGVGLVIGEPTGITGKLYLEDDQAIQAAIGPAFIGGGIALHGEYVIHPWILQDREAFVLPVYLGPGVRFVDYYGGRSGESTFAVGALGVVGMLFDFKEVPLDVFVELGGGAEYNFTDGWGPVLNVGAGVRYYP